jgi:hypothetical protein
MGSAFVLFVVSVGVAAGPGTGLAFHAPFRQNQEILNYKLTLARANKLITAMDGITAEFASRPDFQDRMREAMQMTRAERRAQMEKDPKAMAVLKRNRLTAQEYSVGVPALRSALMAAQGVVMPNIAVSPENLAFAKANLAQLKPKMEAADHLRRRP